MTTDIVPQVRPDSTALSAEHYQTFEMAKEHDGILGGNDIAQIRSYAAYARAQAQAIHKTIAATSGIDDVAAIKAEATETAQTFAKVGIYADQRIGEILRELPTGHGNRFSSTQEPLKAEAIKDAGISRSQAYDLQAMAANPDVVQAVLDKAEAEGRIASRKQVLDAIRQRDEAREEVEQLGEDIGDLQREVAALEAQTDRAYEDGYKAAQHQAQQPQVVERRVEVSSAADQRRIKELEHEVHVVNETHQRLRKQLEDTRQQLQQANDLLGESDRTSNARRDIEQLTIATNSYLRNYGGRAWAFDQFDRVDEPTQQEFIKAITSLSAFAQNLAQMIQDKRQLGANND